jgi:rhodanese-related sulfurtransferase
VEQTAGHGRNAFAREGREGEPMMTPSPIAETGFVVVDATWGTIRPLTLAAGVVTVAELEVIEQLQRGLPVIDTRPAPAYARSTIPGARNLPYGQAVERIDELARDQVTILFCNGPQCAATPDAVEALLAAGYPSGALAYYRGGLHDWQTLGLPVEAGSAESEASEA